MAEGDRPSSWSETDSDSVLSCSVYYSTEFSEDDVLSEKERLYRRFTLKKFSHTSSSQSGLVVNQMWT